MFKKIVIILALVVFLGGLAAYFQFYSEPYEISDSGLIKVVSPRANAVLQTPILIKGEARGFWYFEASFPVKLLDEKGNVIIQTFIQTKSDWMTEDFVPFEKSLDFESPVRQKGTLVLMKDNPSGLPENDDELWIPVILEKTQPQQTISLYYYNADFDKDELGNIQCSRQGIVPVQRKIPITQTPVQDAVKLLLRGELTDEERAQGISTEYPLEGLSLAGASLKDNILTLHFNDPNNQTGGGACRVGILWFQIEATAKQFAGIEQVRFLPEELFQP